MKTINVDFLSTKETIFGLILAYIYDEVKVLEQSEYREEVLPKIMELYRLETTFRNLRFGDEIDRFSLDYLVDMSNVVHIYEKFKNLIGEYFPDYQQLRIVGSTWNGEFREDLKKIDVKATFD